VPAGSEGAYGLAFIEKDRRLAFANGKLCTPFDFTRAFLGKAVNQIFSGFVEPFEIFQKDDIAGKHVPSLELMSE
jgi:hypothetical protein